MDREEIHKAHRDADDYPAYRLILSEEMISKYPDHENACLYRSRALRNLSRFDEAQNVLEDAMNCYSIHEKLSYQLYLNMGRVHEGRFEFKDAGSWYLKSIEKKPIDATPYIFLGCVLARQGRISEAEEWHRKAIECPEGCVDEAYLNLGSVLRAQGKYVEAKACFDRALELDPQYDEALLGQKDMEHVLEFLRDGSLREQLKKQSYERRNNDAYQMDDFPCYRLILEKEILKDYPDCGPGYLQCGRICMNLALYKESLEYIETAIKLCPSYKLSFPYRDMGWLYDLQGEHEKAISWLKKSINESSYEVWPFVTLAEIYIKQGKFDLAESSCRTAIECCEEDVYEAYQFLGYSLRSQERYLEAKECFEMALELNPECQEAQLGLDDMKYVIRF